MIQLFNIPNYQIDTAKFSSLLQDSIIQKFTQEFCTLTKHPYGIPINSATNAIFLLAKIFNTAIYTVPTMIPPVVPNALINANVKFEFIDNYTWIGHSYQLYADKDITIIDSAQSLDSFIPFQGFTQYYAIIYSFYPTKPIGSCDGGMICTNNSHLYDYLITLTNNGSTQSKNSWERKFIMPGWKMYMNSIQAYIAYQNLQNWLYKSNTLQRITQIYNNAFGVRNSSQHLYTIHVDNREEFIKNMIKEEIVCGIHYECAHLNPIYQQQYKNLKNSEYSGLHTVSIPFHEELTNADIDRVIKCVNKYAYPAVI